VERRAYSQKVLFPEKFKPKLQPVEKKSKALDLTDELDEEERLRVEAAEWMPSTVVSKKPESGEGDAIEDKLGSAFDRIKKTVQVALPVPRVPPLVCSMVLAHVCVVALVYTCSTCVHGAMGTAMGIHSVLCVCGG
jgi:hypothetical protein